MNKMLSITDLLNSGYIIEKNSVRLSKILVPKSKFPYLIDTVGTQQRHAGEFSSLKLGWEYFTKLVNR